MNKVITISLNGKTYNLEETGYTALRTYLDNASSRLTENPDTDEIIHDLELAIADKCDTYLTNSKNVISLKEIETIVTEMGPVEGESTTEKVSTEYKHIKKLYRIKDDAIFSGVCTGLGVYFNLDVTLVRIIFILATILTGGIWIVGYITLSCIIPVAKTPEEKSAATGRGIVTAQLLVEKAKHKYNQFKHKINN